MGNTNAGIKEVNNYQQNFLKNQIKKSQIRENDMSIQIPIKQIILEFTADHIRDNAGKYAAGTMLGLGGVAGYLAGDPEHGQNLMGSIGNHSTAPEGHPNISGNNDHTEIRMANGANHHANYATGEGAGLGDHLKNWANDRGNVNYHNNVMDAVNDEHSFLTGGEKAGAIGLGAAGILGGGATLAHRNGYRGSLSRMPGPRTGTGKY